MILFLHLPKTAGMSVRSVITANVCNPFVVDEYAQVAFLNDHQLNSYGAILGHVGAALARRLYEPKTVIFLRNPVDRLASMYSFWKHHPKSAYVRYYSQMPFVDWVKADVFEVRMEREGGMMWQIAVDRSSLIRAQHHASPLQEIFDAACTNLQNAAFIGFQESFSRDIISMCDHFQWANRSVPQVNRSLHQYEVSDAERAEVEQILYWDMKLYKFAQDEYRNRKPARDRLSDQLESTH
ncbi:MAG TPA: sulfotransferase family 2 domain-containing protein [Tepidisphaeraceae bacterium]|nr:sulfotransferase family 2 domain-containing protein [Tepidisphaeraceae bacterium]